MKIELWAPKTKGNKTGNQGNQFFSGFHYQDLKPCREGIPGTDMKSWGCGRWANFCHPFNKK